MKILSFGNIPTWAGGRNDNGLSNVIYQLAANLAKVEDVHMTLVATDVNETRTYHNGLHVVGWTRNALLKYALIRPFTVILYFLYALIFKLKYRQPESIYGIVFKMLHLHKSVKEIRPEIVHLHTAGAIVYLKAIPQNIKIVLTIHGILGHDKHFNGYRHYSKLERDCCRSKRIAKLYYISSKLIDDFKKEYDIIVPSTETILNAFDNESFYYQKIGHEYEKNHTVKLLTVATLSRIKGQDRVLQAIKETSFDCIYECVGGDSDGMEDELKSYAKANNIRYSYYGKRTPQEINKLLANADYMILPSSTEGFGLVYLEAMACGVPVILPKNLPIVQEKGIIKPNENAILLDDSEVDSIAKVLPKLHSLHFDRSEVSKSVSNMNWYSKAKEYAYSFSNL